ncbi:30S ribosomal protein S3 [archaeon]|nr:30S ribosomal protein S3 [archaeon]
MIERKFISKGIRNAELDTYFQKELERVDYSHCEIQRTPLNTRIIIYAGRPGMVIGRGGKKIQDMTYTIEKDFKIEKPQLEVKALENADLNARVISKQIAEALEKGMKHKRIVSIYLKRIMRAGALGVEIDIAGKISGERSRTEKFQEGYIKKSGFPAEDLMSKAMQVAVLKAGTIGVSVKIMKDVPAIMKVEKNISTMKTAMDAAKKKAEEKKEVEELAEETEEKSTDDKTKDDTKDTKIDAKEKKTPVKKKETVAKKEEKAEAKPKVAKRQETAADKKETKTK